MALKNISDLANAGILTGVELLELQQAGINTQATVASIQAFSRNQGASSTPLKPSGVPATDTLNITAAVALAAASGRSVTGASDPIGTAVIDVSPGTFTLTTANALMGPSTLASKLRGLMIRGGGGQGQSEFLFSPSAAGPLMTDQRWQSITMTDMTYGCTLAGCDFMQSQEQGGLTNIQAFNFVRCGFSGFQNTFMLTGGNNNSEWMWDTCSFGATSQNVIYVPPTLIATITGSNANIAVVNVPLAFPLGATMMFTATLGNLIANTSYYIIASTATSIQISASAGGSAIVPTTGGTLSANAGSDQFLNFSLNNCKYDPGSSNAPWVNLGMGGHLTFSGTADVSGWSPTVDTYLIQTLGTAHARGVENLMINHMRMECLSPHALFWRNQWPGGNCTIQNFDDSSTMQAATVSHVLIEIQNTSGPEIVYDNCSFQGHHTYSFGTNAFAFQSSIQYRSCNLSHYPNANGFIVSSGAVNVGGTPVIAFDINCRGTGPTELLPCNLNWHLSTTGIATSWMANFVDLNARMPVNGGNITRILPLHSVLKAVYMLKSADAQTGAFSFTLQTTEATPTVFAIVAGTNAGAAITFLDNTAPLVFMMDTDAKRTVQLVDSQNRAAAMSGCVFVLEYVG